MSYITRTGNLAEAPTLREGENGPYCYARVLVSDRIRQESGDYIDGPYPATLEGAVRSGCAVAQMLCAPGRATSTPKTTG